MSSDKHRDVQRTPEAGFSRRGFFRGVGLGGGAVGTAIFETPAKAAPPPASPRPGLVEGVAFGPDAPPRLRLLSLRRHGDYLFQRARYEWGDA